MMRIESCKSSVPKRNPTGYLLRAALWSLLLLSFPGTSKAADKLVFGWSAIALQVHDLYASLLESRRAS